jgi:hypothetical protein
MNKVQIGFRLDAELVDRARLATDKDKNPYAPTLTQIVERGLELALRELDKKKAG